MKVRSGGRYHQPHREAQAIHREVEVEEVTHSRKIARNFLLFSSLYSRIKMNKEINEIKKIIIMNRFIGKAFIKTKMYYTRKVIK